MGRIVALIICAILLILGVNGIVRNTVYEKSCKQSLTRMLYYFSILITFTILIMNLDRVMDYIMKITNRYISGGKYSNIANIVCLLIIFFCMQFIIFRLVKLICTPFYNKKNLQGILKPSSIVLSIFLGISKGFIVITIMFIGVVTYNSTVGRNYYIDIFDSLKSYENVNRIIKTEKANYVYVEDIIASEKSLVYYNGVTLEEGIKSSDDIDDKAEELVEHCNSDREKAKKIYSWIGANIDYDMEKAILALNDEELSNSGAIAAWNDKKGICFDYACLYVAMARKVGLRVRLVTGKAYDGDNYGAHAWNQVYLQDEKKWINVDPTFYLAGDYFDSYEFSDDHIMEDIAGQW